MSVDNSLEPNFKSPRANWVQVERLKKKNWCYCFLSAFYLYLVLKKLSFFSKLLISSPVVQFSWLLALLHYVVRPFLGQIVQCGRCSLSPFKHSLHAFISSPVLASFLRILKLKSNWWNFSMWCQWTSFLSRIRSLSFQDIWIFGEATVNE